MAATSTQIMLDAPAPDFRLPATDGRVYALGDIAGDNGTVIAFICNHCPYVLAVIDRLVADARALKLEGVGFACICSNDAEAYPDNSFDKMKEFAKAHGFLFPYLHDETQQVARAYGAVCTPDFFGYDRARKLKYRGRSGRGPHDAAARRREARACRGDARHRRDGHGATGANSVDRLFDQMEGVARRIDSRAKPFGSAGVATLCPVARAPRACDAFVSATGFPRRRMGDEIASRRLWRRRFLIVRAPPRGRDGARARHVRASAFFAWGIFAWLRDRGLDRRSQFLSRADQSAPARSAGQSAGRSRAFAL